MNVPSSSLLVNYIFLFTIILSSILSAQNIFTENSISFNASGSFYSTTHRRASFSESNYSLNGYLLYHITSKIAFGPSLHYNYLITPEFSKNNKRWEKESFGFGPLTRYYILDKGNILPFLSTSYFYSISSYNHSKSKIISNEIFIGFGSDFFLSERVLFELIINYVKTFNNSEKQYINNTQTVNTDYSKIQFFFGFGVLL